MRELDQGLVAAYLSRRLGSRVVVDRLKRSFPGISRETWLLATHVGDEEKGFVLRVDPPEGSSFPFPLKQEWEVYRRLYGSEVPVAEPLWFDEDIEFAEGRPHMVRRLVEGGTLIPGLSDAGIEGEKLRRRIAFECVEKLALVHRLDWKARGFHEVLPAPASPREALSADFALWRGFWERERPGPDPIIEEALCWMQENIPTDTPFISLVKGNNGVGEEIFRYEKIAALSDWEGAALSDSVLDLFWAQGTLELTDFGDTIRHYEECLGAKLSLERMAFARLHIFFKAIVCLRCYLYRHFSDGRTSRPYGPSFLISYSAELEKRLAQSIGKSLVEAWHIIGGGTKNLYSTLGGEKR